jgi:hypothetical protein
MTRPLRGERRSTFFQSIKVSVILTFGGKWHGRRMEVKVGVATTGSRQRHRKHDSVSRVSQIYPIGKRNWTPILEPGQRGGGPAVTVVQRPIGPAAVQRWSSDPAGHAGAQLPWSSGGPAVVQRPSGPAAQRPSGGPAVARRSSSLRPSGPLVQRHRPSGPAAKASCRLPPRVCRGGDGHPAQGNRRQGSACGGVT